MTTEAGEGDTEIRIERYTQGTSAQLSDRVVLEEPLEIRLDGHPLAVLMRTPGRDRELVTGFLITEGILRSPAQIESMRLEDNRMLVFLTEETQVDIGKLSRNMFAGSSCGICGKATLEAVLTEFPAIPIKSFPTPGSLLSAPELMLASQRGFSATGGVHAAGLFDLSGRLLALREDIGRHNAVDKVVGYALASGIGFPNCWLMVSGRVSFEIMQKSLAAGIPCVAAISAPSSLAVEFAKKSGQALFGFLRPPTFNRYA